MIIPAIYNHSILEPNDLISNLKFIGVEDQDIEYPRERHSQAVPITEEIENLFMHKLHRYLRGYGHPQHPAVDAHLPFEDVHPFHGNKVLRSRLFLRFASGSELLPVDVWNVKVSI